MSQSRFWNLLAKKLAGEASPEEIRELEKLIAENPDWHYPTEHIEELWQSKKITDPYDSELAFEMHLNKLKEAGIKFSELEKRESIPDFVYKNTSRNKRKAWVFFAFLLVLFMAGWMWFKRPEKKLQPVIAKNYSEVSSPLKSKTKLILPDSSVVWLNAGSKLTYNENFGTKNREAVLSGEAFFDVKKSSVPFIIHANKVHIKVLGTAFNVKAYPDEGTTETSLIHGKVEITLEKRPGEKFILKPNEKLIVANEPETPETDVRSKEPIVVLKELTRTFDSTVVETSWVENKLVFQDESFFEIAKKMERWYGVGIQFKDESIGKERISGTFTTETIHEALERLQMTTPFHFVSEENKIIITHN